MKKMLVIILFLSIVISFEISAQGILHVPLSSKKDKHDTNLPRVEILPIRPFTYRINPVFLPDSLGGDKYSANINIEAWIDSSAVLLSMYPKRITLYKKGSENPKDKVKSFKDSNWGTVKWENITPEAKQYINWINKILPKNITFRRLKDSLPPGVEYLPKVKSRNYVSVIVHVK